MAIERHKEIRRRRRRRRKVRLLRARLAKAKTQSDRQRIVAKMRRVSPHAPLELPEEA